jgi:ferritin-like metal-binding protein YciE
MVMTVRQLCVVRGGLVAAYGCVKTWAGLLGETQAQSLLEQTLNEEKTAARD